MKRRKLLATVGTIAGTSGVIGSGAFTSVDAERTIKASVADDDRALLRLEPLVGEGLDDDGDGDPEVTGRSFTSGQEVSFELPGDERGENSNAEGLGVDSIYEFHDLLNITNQGTKPVEVFSEFKGSELNDLALVTDAGLLRTNRPTLNVGESVDVGLYLDTDGSTTGEYDETLTIVAETTEK